MMVIPSARKFERYPYSAGFLMTPLWYDDLSAAYCFQHISFTVLIKVYILYIFLFRDNIYMLQNQIGYYKVQKNDGNDGRGNAHLYTRKCR